MARSMLSLGMFSPFAARIAVRRRGFELASPPPMRAAMVSSRIRRVNTRPRLASVAAFLCLMVAHFECPDMTLPSFRESRLCPAGRGFVAESCSEPRPGRRGQNFSRGLASKPSNLSKFNTALRAVETRLYSHGSVRMAAFSLCASHSRLPLDPPVHSTHGQAAFQSFGDCFPPRAVHGAAFPAHGGRTGA